MRRYRRTFHPQRALEKLYAGYGLRYELPGLYQDVR